MMPSEKLERKCVLERKPQTKANRRNNSSMICCKDKSQNSSNISFIDAIIKNYENTKKMLQKNTNTNRTETRLKTPSSKYIERCQRMNSKDINRKPSQKAVVKTIKSSTDKIPSLRIKSGTATTISESNKTTVKSTALSVSKKSVSSTKFLTARSNSKSFDRTIQSSVSLTEQPKSNLDSDSSCSEFKSTKISSSSSWLETSLSQKLFDSKDFLFYEDSLQSDSSKSSKTFTSQVSNKSKQASVKSTKPTTRNSSQKLPKQAVSPVFAKNSDLKEERKKREKKPAVENRLVAERYYITPEISFDLLCETIYEFLRSVYNNVNIRILALDHISRNSRTMNELIRIGINFLSKRNGLSTEINRDEIINGFGSYLKWINRRDETISSCAINDILNESCLLWLLNRAKAKPSRSNFKNNMEFYRSIVRVMLETARLLNNDDYDLAIGDIYPNNEFLIRLSIISDKYNSNNRLKCSVDYEETIEDLQYLRCLGNPLDKVVTDFLISRTKSQAVTTDWLSIVMGKSILPELKESGDLT